MCLALPGAIEEILSHPRNERLGRVNFGGIHREINLDCVPDAVVGDFIIAHAGVALQILDREEAHLIIEEFKRLEDKL